MSAAAGGFVDPERERSGVWGWLGELVVSFLADEYEDDEDGPNGEYVAGTLK